MYYYPEINKFIYISKVDNLNKHVEKIRKFKNDLLHYQEAVADTILIINTIDNFESFYAYVIFSYYLYLTNRIFNKYNIGIGIFNL